MENKNNNVLSTSVRSWSLKPMHTPNEKIVKTATGNYLGVKGKPFNLLEFTGNTTNFIFFNPNSSTQSQFVNDYLNLNQHKEYKLCVSEGDRDATENIFGCITRFDRYAKLSSYFGIVVLPAVVEIVGNEYQITEFWSL